MEGTAQEALMSLEEKYGKRPESAPSQYRSVPQEIANAMEVAAKEALLWTPAQGPFLGDPRFEISDEEVEERIAGWSVGYMREYLRVIRPEEPHRLQDLPVEIKRALCERWDGIFTDWLRDHPEVCYDYLEARFFLVADGSTYQEASGIPWGSWSIGPTTTVANTEEIQ